MSLPPTSSAASPLAIEREFRALLLRLNYPTSARRQLQEIEYFLAKVLPQSRRYESYILEIVQRIPEIIQRMNIIGIDPESLRSVYENVKELNIALPSLSSVNGLAAAMQRLRLAISTLFTYVGEASTGTEFETEHVLDVEGSFTATTDSLLIPVVERSLVDTPGSLREFGSLRKISVEITGYSESGKDLFQPQVHVLGKGDHLQDVLAVPIRAARALLLQTNPGLHDTYFAGSVIFDELNSFHQGSSANLAIAALVYSALLRYVQAREQFSIKDNVTATGDINEGGDILPVDASSLRLKTEAVFFSGISFFVVPSSQLLFAEQVVDSLKTRYPNRRLVLV
ncbi:MAG TPA: hypothetical protein VI758_00535, partial [Bacteroidota bacterium]